YCTKLGRISIVRICSYRYLGWRYGVYTQRSLNTLIVVKGILVADELQRVNSSRSETLKDIHERSDGSALTLYDLRLGVSLLVRSPAIESVVVVGATSSFEMRRIA
ncbi:hypothetical protein Tco_0048084, partial [Tanacetum coccineum]